MDRNRPLIGGNRLRISIQHTIRLAQVIVQRGNRTPLMQGPSNQIDGRFVLTILMG